jgi:hypothetical protein
MAGNANGDLAYSGPGLMFVSASITNTNELSEETFHKWYNDIHIPDVLVTGGVTHAARFENADPSAEYKFLALYTLPDLAFAQSEQFKTIPNSDPTLPGSGLCFDSIKFDIRFYKLIQTDPETDSGAGRCNPTMSQPTLVFDHLRH